MNRAANEAPASAASNAGWHIGLVSVALAALTAVATTRIAQAQTPAPAPVPYTDRVLDLSGSADDGIALKSSEYNASGWPRSLRIDYALTSQRGASNVPTSLQTNTQTRAIGIGGFLDTPDHGALSLAANLSRQTGGTLDNLARDSISTWRIDQRSLPLEGGWRANHSAGDINTVSTSLARGLGRVLLPTSPVRGLAGQWYQGDAFSVNAAAGRTGLFNGLDLAGFEPSGGVTASAGGQYRVASNALGWLGSGQTDTAVQIIKAQNITDGAGFGTAQNTQGFWAAIAWEGAAPWAVPAVSPGGAAGVGGSGGLGGFAGVGSGPVQERVGGLRVQGNVARSASTVDGNALGLWADAAWRTERWRNAAGLFRFEPGLRWGTAFLASDFQGVYLQADTFTRQWQAGYAAEFSDSVRHASGKSAKSAFLNVNGRYRLDTQSALGAALSVRALNSPGEAIQLTWDQTNDWGQTQWRGDLARTSSGRTTRMGVDQSWPVGFPNSLNTSLAWERTAGDVSPGTGWIWGVLGTLAPFADWSLDAAVRGARRSDGAQSLNANVGLRWQPRTNWSLALRYTQSRGQDPLSPLVVSALTAAATAPLIATQTGQTSQSVQLLLRYEESAGRASAPIGGVVGSGAGTLSGSVFFDGDSNGRREASETGVPGVTVILNRRFVARTDAQGRYEFPAVAAGEHVIEVSSDNVPLPWSPALRDAVKVRLYVRQLTTQDFAVQRER